MGREIRTYHVTVKFRLDELNRVEDCAQHLKLSRAEYIRVKALERIDKTETQRERRQLKAKLDCDDFSVQLILLQELKKQGVNLNQIAKKINGENLSSKVVSSCLKDINIIGEANKEISLSIATLIKKGKK